MAKKKTVKKKQSNKAVKKKAVKKKPAKKTKKKAKAKKPTKKKIARKKSVRKTSAQKKAVKKKLPEPPAYKDTTQSLYECDLPTEQEEFLDAIYTSVPRVDKFLNSGVDINKLIAGHPPICHSASCGPESVLKHLLKNGADPTAAPVLLETTETSKTKILLAAGADPNARVGDETPLLRAVDNTYSQKTVSLLLKAGAEITDAVKKRAKQLNDPQVLKLLGLKDAPPTPAKLYIPPLLPKPMKAAYQRVYDVTGYPPLGVEGITVFVCQVVPDQFLSDKDALKSNALHKATEIVAKELFSSVPDVEFVRSDIQHGNCVLMVSSKNKFIYLKKPKKLFDMLKKLDAKHPVDFLSLESGRFTYPFKRKLTTAQAEHWRAELKGLGIDGLTIRVSEQQLTINHET